MDNRRQGLLNQLETAARKTVRTDDDLVSLIDALHSLGFQIMYGLPAELQFRAAFHMDAMMHGLKRWEECECTFLTPIYVERGNSPDYTPE